MATMIQTVWEVFDLAWSSRGKHRGFFQAVPALWGHAGVGKTDSVKQFAKKRNMECTIVHVGQFDSPGDLLGMPERKNGETVYLPPAWFPQKKKPTLLFFDEVNRGNMLLQQALLPVLLDRRLGQLQIPEETFIVAACNPPDGEYMVNELDPALMDRMMHIVFSSTFTQWLVWAKNHGLHPEVANTLSHVRDESNVYKMGIIKNPRTRCTFRSTMMFNALYSAQPNMTPAALRLVARGLLGEDLGKVMVESLSTKEKPIQGADILDHYPKVRAQIFTWSRGEHINYAMLEASLNSMMNEVAMRSTSENISEIDVVDRHGKHIANFLLDLPADVRERALHAINERQWNVKP